MKTFYNPKENTDVHNKNVIFRHDKEGKAKSHVFGLKGIKAKHNDIVFQDVKKRLIIKKVNRKV